MIEFWAWMIAIAAGITYGVWRAVTGRF